MAHVLKAGDLAPDDLFDLVTQFQAPAGERLRVWLEAPDGWALADWPGLSGTLPWSGAGRLETREPAEAVLRRSFAGRLFSPSGELRWRVLPSLGECCCRVVFLGTVDAIPGRLEPRDELAGLKAETRHYLLWGQRTERSGDAWIELRIPHRFHYPVDAPEPGQGRVGVKAELEVWCDGQGEPQLMRLCDLHPYTER
jgi:hypothetical protein